MRRAFLAIAAAAVLGAVAVAPAAAITGNYREDNDHPFVGLVAFYNSDWEFIHRCTGELLSPTVLLRAGHCTNYDSLPNGAVAAHARVCFLQDVGSHLDPVTQVDPVTGYADSCSGTLGDGLAEGWCAESSTMFNYGFDNFAGFPNIHDLGIVILDQAIELPEYASLASAGTVESLVRARGTQDVTMRVSGYGLSYRLITPPKGPNAGGANNLTLSFRVRLQADEIFTNLYNANSAARQPQSRGRRQLVGLAQCRLPGHWLLLPDRPRGLPRVDPERRRGDPLVGDHVTGGQRGHSGAAAGGDLLDPAGVVEHPGRVVAGVGVAHALVVGGG